MSILELVTGADKPILRTKCEKVTCFDALLEQMIDTMVQTMTQKTEDGSALGIGLAAPQVGINARVCLVTLGVDGKAKNQRILTLINPEYLTVSADKCIMEEGCLSLPGVFGKVRRPKKIQLKWQNSAGTWCERKFAGWDARVIQHEIDHLDGILFTDYNQS